MKIFLTRGQISFLPYIWLILILSTTVSILANFIGQRRKVIFESKRIEREIQKQHEDDNESHGRGGQHTLDEVAIDFGGE